MALFGEDKDKTILTGGLRINGEVLTALEAIVKEDKGIMADHVRTAIKEYVKRHGK